VKPLSVVEAPNPKSRRGGTPTERTAEPCENREARPGGGLTVKGGEKATHDLAGEAARSVGGENPKKCPSFGYPTEAATEDGDGYVSPHEVSNSLRDQLAIGRQVRSE